MDSPVPPTGYQPDNWFGPAETRGLERPIRTAQHNLANRVQVMICDLRAEFVVHAKAEAESRAAHERRTIELIEGIDDALRGGVNIKELGLNGVVLEHGRRLDTIEERNSTQANRSWGAAVGAGVALLGVAVKGIWDELRGRPHP